MAQTSNPTLANTTTESEDMQRAIDASLRQKCQFCPAMFDNIIDLQLHQVNVEACSKSIEKTDPSDDEDDSPKQLTMTHPSIQQQFNDHQQKKEPEADNNEIEIVIHNTEGRTNSKPTNISFTNEYKLNEKQTILKKIVACGRENYNIENRINSATVTFNTAAFEFFRSNIMKFYEKSPEVYQAKLQAEEDRTGKITHDIIKVCDLSKRKTPNIYTINIYRTTCRVMVNGPHHVRFLQEVLPVVTSTLDNHADEIDARNTQYKETLLSFCEPPNIIRPNEQQSSRIERPTIEPKEAQDHNKESMMENNKPHQQKDEAPTTGEAKSKVICTPTHQSPKPTIRNITTATGSCHCLAGDNEDMIQCGDCKSWTHYACCTLPAYMLKQLCTKNRKYQCEKCVSINADDIEKYKAKEQHPNTQRVSPAPKSVNGVDIPTPIEQIQRERDEALKEIEKMKIQLADEQKLSAASNQESATKTTQIKALEKEIKQEKLALKQEKKKVNELKATIALRNNEMEKLKTPTSTSKAIEDQLRETVTTQERAIDNLREQLSRQQQTIRNNPPPPPATPAANTARNGERNQQTISPTYGTDNRTIIAVTNQLLCPAKTIGIVVGKQGSRIKKLEHENAVIIVVERSKDNNDNQTVFVTGRPSNVKRTISIINKLITCKFYKTSTCRHGEACRFAHRETTAQQSDVQENNQERTNDATPPRLEDRSPTRQLTGSPPNVTPSQQAPQNANQNSTPNNRNNTTKNVCPKMPQLPL